MAEYYATGRSRITKVIPNDDFTLAITFDNGEVRLYDAAPLRLPRPLRILVAGGNIITQTVLMEF